MLRSHDVTLNDLIRMESTLLQHGKSLTLADQRRLLDDLRRRIIKEENMRLSFLKVGL